MPKSERRVSAPINPGLLGIITLAIVVATLAIRDSKLEILVRTEWLDTYQRLFPRTAIEHPVIIVEIDERSLEILGQWPWPRSRLAGLIAEITEAAPAVIGIDVLFVEPDRYAPHALVMALGLDPTQATELARTLPDSDALFAKTLTPAPVVLGVAGIAEKLQSVRHEFPASPVLQKGGNALDFVRRYPDVLRSLPKFDRAAKGHGAMNSETERGIVRRVPTVIGTEAGHLIPGFAIEILRFLGGRAPLQLVLSPAGIREARVAGLRIPTQGDGEWWLHFSPWEKRPAYSAADIIRGNYSRENLHRKIVLIGYTALGLQDLVTTPIGRMPGVEVHAEALENALSGRLLVRTSRLAAIELGLLLVLGVVAILGVVYLRPLFAIGTFAVFVAAAMAGGCWAFLKLGWLLDAANPTLGATIVLAITFSAALGETQSQRRQLGRDLAVTREAQARLQGELDAARRIQRGMLPDSSQLGHEPRVDIAGRMLPAKTVGGDFYDFFTIDDHRLFFLIGDVSGKGLPSALFMALAKAHIRSAALRADGDPGATLTSANRTLTQDNPEFLFITAFVAELNLENGNLRWSNAGHDSPYLLANQALDNSFASDGPPLCAVDDFVYPGAAAHLPVGTTFCLFTDGVTDGSNGAELFGSQRLVQALTSLLRASDAESVVTHLVETVATFVGNAEQADDITVLCVRRAHPPQSDPRVKSNHLSEH